jgi:hypothetical protein
VVVTGALPKIDEHEIQVGVSPDEAWTALVRTFSGLTTHAGWRVIAKALRCQPGDSSGDPDAVGASLPGFRVTRSVPSRQWSLEGRHLFSRYSLTFRIAPLGADRSQISAESSAVFPGPQGRTYRALVIGTGGHVVGVRNILRRVKIEAERTRS